MKIKDKNFIVEYDESLTYIPELIENLKIHMYDILNFFGLDKLDRQRKIIVYNDLELYKEHIRKFHDYYDYMCADTNDGNVNILSLKEAHKTKEHKEMTLENLKSTMLHEFVHCCQQATQIENYDHDIVWFWEALATNLGNPEAFNQIPINASNEEISSFIALKGNYSIAFTIGNYLLENYSHEQILDYVKYPSKLQVVSNKILNQAKEWSHNIDKAK